MEYLTVLPLLRETPCDPGHLTEKSLPGSVTSPVGPRLNGHKHSAWKGRDEMKSIRSAFLSAAPENAPGHPLGLIVFFVQ